jgi:hypothetical protein
MGDAYLVPAVVPRNVAKIGWDPEFQSYWFIVYRKGPFGETEVEDPEVVFTMGVGGAIRQITNVGDLLNFTWEEIDWDSPDGLYAIRALRDDPIFDAVWGGENRIGTITGMDDFICHAFDSQAITDANTALRGGVPEEVAPPTPGVAGKPPRSVPTAEQRLPTWRRLLSRKG